MNINLQIFHNQYIVLEFIILILNLQILICCLPQDNNNNIIIKGRVEQSNIDNVGPNVGHQNYLNIINNLRDKKDRYYMSHSSEHNYHMNKTRKSLTSSSSIIRKNKKKNSQLKEKCRKSEKELDLCSAQLLAFGISEAAFPNNIEQFDSDYCPNFKKLVHCIKNNLDCYQPFEKQVISWVTISSRKMNYKRCKFESEKLRFLRLTTSCFSDMKNPMEKCMKKYVAHLEAIADLNDFIERLSENDIQIQLSCCANRRYKQCILNNAKDQCKPFDSLKKLKRTNSISSQRNAQKQLEKIMQDTVNDLELTLDNMALTGPEFICSNVDEHYCKTYFDGKIIGRQTKHKSIIPAMIKIYSNL